MLSFSDNELGGKIGLKATSITVLYYAYTGKIPVKILQLLD